MFFIVPINQVNVIICVALKWIEVSIPILHDSLQIFTDIFLIVNGQFGIHAETLVQIIGFLIEHQNIILGELILLNEVADISILRWALVVDDHDCKVIIVSWILIQ